MGLPITLAHFEAAHLLFAIVGPARGQIYGKIRVLARRALFGGWFPLFIFAALVEKTKLSSHDQVAC